MKACKYIIVQSEMGTYVANFTEPEEAALKLQAIEELLLKGDPEKAALQSIRRVNVPRTQVDHWSNRDDAFCVKVKIQGERLSYFIYRKQKETPFEIPNIASLLKAAV